MSSVSRSSNVSSVISVAPKTVASCPKAILLVFASPFLHFSKNSAMSGDYIMGVFYDILFFRLRAISIWLPNYLPFRQNLAKVYDHAKRTCSCDRYRFRKDCSAIFYPCDCGFLGTLVQSVQNGCTD